MKTASIDNSSLNNLLSSSEKLKCLNKLLKEDKIRLIISMDTLNESLSGEKPDLIHLRLVELSKLVKTYTPNNLVISRGSNEYIKKEILRNGILKNIPSFINSPRWPNFIKILEDKEKFCEFHKKAEAIRNDSLLIKFDLKAADKAFRELCKINLEQNDLKNELCNFKKIERFEQIKTISEAFKYVSKRKIRKSLFTQSQNKFIFLRTYLTCMYIRAIGNAITDFDNLKEFKFLSKINQGNWYDISAISTSSRFEYLITDDTDQADFCLYLKSIGCVTCDPITTNDFLKI